MRKRWTLLPADDSEVEQLRQALNIHPIFCKLLVQRGIKTFEHAKAFFRPHLSQLHDPFLMKDMHAAVARLETALAKQERILLYGDYDVDGTTSVALMYAFLEKRSHSLDYYLPDRYKEGYGVSMAGVDYAFQNGVSLIIAMDCGIQAALQVSRAKELGIDFIICDHHLPDGRLPEAAAVLDPKRHDCPYPYKELSGCGIAFKLAHAFSLKNGIPWAEMEALLDFLVVSIAADIVPITGENRVLAHFGLEKLNHTERPGLKALKDQAARPYPLHISDVVFGLAPLINAAGRLADAQQAVRLLLSADKFVAHDNARVLEHRNKLRKEYESAIVREATELLTSQPGWEERRSIVLFQPHWHKGVIGIAASRMVEQYHRPAIILTESNGKAVGSARSVNGFNLFEAIKNCSALLENYGGHDHAAGLTMALENVPFLIEKFEAEAHQRMAGQEPIPEIEVSSVLAFKDITPAFWKILKQFAPFGPENHNPVFVSKNVVVAGPSRLLKGNHLRLSIKQGDSPVMYGVAFEQGEAFAKVMEEKPFHICYKLEENQWEGHTYLQLLVQDFWFSETRPV
jgi:single-stranded-DNA-specific exonuclease